MPTPQDDVAIKWLEDAPAMSAHVLAMLNTPVPPDPGPEPMPSSGFYKPNSVADFVAAQQKCLDDGHILMLDPSTVLEFTAPVEFKARGTKFPTGLWAYGSLFKWKTDGNWMHTMLR